MTQQITKSNKQQPRLSALAELFREGGVAIRYEQGKEKDTQICLTDMWKANGADRSKKPYDWLRSLDGSEYIQAFLEESKRSELLTISQTRHASGFGKCVAIPTLESRSASVEEAPLQIAKSIGVIATIKGRYGGTFAHLEVCASSPGYWLYNPGVSIASMDHCDDCERLLIDDRRANAEAASQWRNDIEESLFS